MVARKRPRATRARGPRSHPAMKPIAAIVTSVVVIAAAHAEAQPPVPADRAAALTDNPDDATPVERDERPTPPADVPPARPPTGRFEIGVGFSSDENFVAHAAIAQDDLFGTGQRLALTADLSARRQTFGLAHEVPDLLSTGLDLRTELFSTRRQHPGFVRDGAGGAVTVGHRLDRTTRVYLRYRVEQIGVSLDGTDADGAAASARSLVPPSLGDGLLAGLGAGFAYETLDARDLPTRGSRLELFAERAAPWLGSEHDLVRVAAAADHARPLGRFTLRLQGRGAYVHSRDPGGVPLSERLQHDGHAELRGYPLGSLGPFAFGDRAIGGADLEASGRVELELPVWRAGGLSVAAFADAGVRHNGEAAWGPTGAELHRSVGASIIWRSPIGPLRFDWAIPLDGPDRRPVFLFGLGGSF